MTIALISSPSGIEYRGQIIMIILIIIIIFYLLSPGDEHVAIKEMITCAAYFYSLLLSVYNSCTGVIDTVKYNQLPNKTNIQ
jgi:hypothetical protein